MAEYCLSRSLFDQFKRMGRETHPDVSPSHLIESIARGFEFTSWAALNTYLTNDQAASDALREFSYEAMRNRLLELGYAPSPSWPEHFGAPDAATRAARARLMLARERTFWTLDELVERRMLGQSESDLLKQLAQRRATMLISGATGSGKTTLLHALLAERAQRYPDEQFSFFVDVVEATGFPANVLQNEAPLSYFSDNLKSLSIYRRAAGTTNVLGEIRTSDAAAVAATNWRRHGGGLACIHAGSPDDALARFADLLGGSTSGGRIVDAVVQMKRARDRGIEEIRMTRGVL
ncbi:ATPase, T2SS/T4P/T4SS family [Paraburkholderia sp. SIMBA_054]|uniref:ATPase, T2SS/T4P/T4SS family n=1 Tax=Paraburkholderia sp. SIMBA_054 TaxID=3085795 RepID=UPI00397C1EE0